MCDLVDVRLLTNHTAPDTYRVYIDFHAYRGSAYSDLLFPLLVGLFTDSGNKTASREKKLSGMARRQLKKLRNEEATLPVRRTGHEEKLDKPCAAGPRSSTEPRQKMANQSLSGGQGGQKRTPDNLLSSEQMGLITTD